MKKKSILNSPRLNAIKKRRRKVYRNRVIFFAICFLIIFVGLAFISRIDKININEIKISGNKIIETKDIEEVVKENISGHYLWVFPKSNFIIYPKAKIKRELADKFKRFKEIKLDVQNIKTLEISVLEREAEYTWCGAVLPTWTSDVQVDQKCYFMDSFGYIFDEAPYFSGEVYFKFYGKTDSNNENPSGNYFLLNNFNRIILFIENIKLMNLEPSVFVLDEGGEGNIYLSSNKSFPMNPKLIFKINSDFEKLIENLQAITNTEPLKTELVEKFNSLLYIDLRFGNKVYYKFQ